MTYMYDTVVNFQKELYEFFEWNNKDNLYHIKKIPILKLSKEDIFKIFKYRIRINKEILNIIENKTEKYNLSKIKYSTIFTDSNNSIVLLFDDNGCEIGRSKLLIEDEEEIRESIIDEPERIISIEKLSKFKLNFLTRKELLIRNKIISNLKKTYKEKDNFKLEYIYYEWFGKEINDSSKMYCELMKDISNNFNNKHIELYNDLMLEEKQNNY